MTGNTPSGAVYGVLMNFRSEWDALAAQMHDAPYKAPPHAPVLYVKPANTFSAHGAPIAVPARVAEVAIGATLAIVMGADSNVAGYLLMNDLSIPHDSFFRPPVKLNCLDGFLGIGARMVPAAELGDPAHVELEVRINGAWRQTLRFDQLLRPAAQLLADVNAFMTLGPGDMLMLGCDPGHGGRPRGRVGDRIDISSALLGTLSNTLVAETA